MGRSPERQTAMADTFQNSKTPVYVGEFCHAIDGKNRITIPSEWRPADGGEAEFFLIPSSTANCLTVMPRHELDRIRTKAAELPGAQRTAALRRIGAMSRQVTLDKHGRLSLPEEFCKQLHLGGNVTLSGVVETFEIWNTTEWTNAQASQKAASDPILADLGL
jgi:division/cell wall cluster transcriptional repressor MraZ